MLFVRFHQSKSYELHVILTLQILLILEIQWLSSKAKLNKASPKKNRIMITDIIVNRNLVTSNLCIVQNIVMYKSRNMN